ncbi:hypothetical protein RDWZM_003750 [Blomia tropicalis]|uniref:PIPK domain-containing protein n=1 Tax=Blomia tropicalis TaxID=40697 RepID=A0A9Q0RT01_BLOTA|nr:Phosphatidylinositol 4-phosphate 5-kinase type-1 beta [Blomia tropicalis]KAJ6225205.1 hypothetical protein RDWZM_003750 [Blomia tropicalis]
MSEHHIESSGRGEQSPPPSPIIIHKSVVHVQLAGTPTDSSVSSTSNTTTPEHQSPELSSVTETASTSYKVPLSSLSSTSIQLNTSNYPHHVHFSNHDPSCYSTSTSIDSSPPPYTELTINNSSRFPTNSQDELSVDWSHKLFEQNGTHQQTLVKRLETSSMQQLSSQQQQQESPNYHQNSNRPSSSRDNNHYPNQHHPAQNQTNLNTRRNSLETGNVSKEGRLGHRRVQNGEVTYKNIQSSQIMYSIQLGIGHSVGSLASKPERDVLYNDFNTIETVAFPKAGTTTTPAHHFTDYEFTTYTPNAFRHFRDLFRIQPDDFMLSMTNEPLQELSNPGASGSMFFRTDDDQFIIKTVEKNESKFLLKLLPGYYMNLSQNPQTLLPKFFGLYTYECGGRNIRLIVMNNLLPSNVRLHEKYDLKGSTYKRKASDSEREKSSPTYKDLDFLEKYHLSEKYKNSTITLNQLKQQEEAAVPTIPDYEDTDFGGLLLEAHVYDELIHTMQRDCRVLESFEIMDYSLLVGIHNYDRSIKDRDDTFDRFDYDDDDQLPAGAIRARNHKGDRLLLFVGIIDILQSYRLFKRVEHAWKSLLHDGDTISVTRPKFYAKRFLYFMQKFVFGRLPEPGSSKNDKYSYYYTVAENQKKYGYNSLLRGTSMSPSIGSTFR